MNGGESRELTFIGRPLPDKGQERTAPSPLPSRPTIWPTLGLPLMRGTGFQKKGARSNGRRSPSSTNDSSSASSSLSVAGRGRTTIPIGQEIFGCGHDWRRRRSEWLTMAGVAPSIRQQPAREAAAIVYLPLLAVDRRERRQLLVRSSVEPRRTLPEQLRQELFVLDREPAAQSRRPR